MNDLNQEPKVKTPEPDSNKRAIVIMITFVVMIVFLIAFELYTKK